MGLSYCQRRRLLRMALMKLGLGETPIMATDCGLRQCISACVIVGSPCVCASRAPVLSAPGEYLFLLRLSTALHQHCSGWLSTWCVARVREPGRHRERKRLWAVTRLSRTC